MASQSLSRAPVRIRVALLLILAAGLLLGARLFYWQIIRWDDLRSRAEGEQAVKRTIEPRRGDISSSDGQLFAKDVFVYTISVTPKLVTNPADLAKQLAPILGQPADKIYSKMMSEKPPVVLAKEVPATMGEAVADIQNQKGMYGLQVDARRVRVYPNGAFAAPVIGYVNAVRISAYWVEQFKDTELRGVDGKISGAADALREVIPFDVPVSQPAIDGANIVLTIDSAIQRIAETELTNAIRATGSTSGSIIILDPKTGAILAMAVYPTADLNQYFLEANQDKYKNQAVSAYYEPGSTMKIMTVAAGLDAGVITPSSVWDDNGVIYVGGEDVHNHENLAPGRVNLTQVLQKSLNVEAAKIAIALGADRFYRYIRSFGFGSLTRVELAAEVAVDVKLVGDGRWHEIDLATNSYGQGISVTPLQMVAAVGAVANQGKLMRPYIVQQIQYSDGRVFNASPQVVRQVIKPETAKTLTTILADSILVESTNKAIVPGYRIAGKTGTASIPIPGGYDTTRTIASFAGYLPADDPSFVILVKLDKPQTSDWGSQVASPVFASVAKQLVDVVGLAPDSIRAANR